LGNSVLRFGVARRRSTPGGGPLTSPSISSRGGRPIHRPMTSSCATEAMLSRSRSGGGRVIRITSGRHFSPSHTRPRMALQTRTSAPRRRVGTGSSASMCSIGRTSARAPIRVPSRCYSPGRHSVPPVRCASGPRAGGHRRGCSASDQVTVKFVFGQTSSPPLLSASGAGASTAFVETLAFMGLRHSYRCGRVARLQARTREETHDRHGLAARDG
jgi:hypothetical protein